MAEKLSIKETTEVYDFAQGTLEDLVKHKSDDGKIDIGEWAQTGAANSPAALKAFMGISDVDDELRDLDAEETKILATKSIKLVQALMALVMAKSE